MQDLAERCPEPLQMILIDKLAEPLLEEADKGPYIVCALQECRRMNVLLGEINKSLSDLEKGLNGQLNMTQAMEDLSEALTLGEVPGRNPFHLCSWEKHAWPSRKPLEAWFSDLLRRQQQAGPAPLRHPHPRSSLDSQCSACAALHSPP